MSIFSRLLRPPALYFAFKRKNGIRLVLAALLNPSVLDGETPRLRASKKHLRWAFTIDVLGFFASLLLIISLLIYCVTHIISSISPSTIIYILSAATGIVFVIDRLFIPADIDRTIKKASEKLQEVANDNSTWSSGMFGAVEVDPLNPAFVEQFRLILNQTKGKDNQLYKADRDRIAAAWANEKFARNTELDGNPNADNQEKARL